MLTLALPLEILYLLQPRATPDAPARTRVEGEKNAETQLLIAIIDLQRKTNYTNNRCDTLAGKIVPALDRA